MEFKIIPYRVLLFLNYLPKFFFQDWAGWGIFTVIPGNPRRTKGDSQHLEARPELQDWLRSELCTVKNSRTGPFPNYLGNNFELYSISGGGEGVQVGARNRYHLSFWRFFPSFTAIFRPIWGQSM